MARLFDEFGNLRLRNEAEVSQNFILPLLQGYLGYDLKEVIPERYYAVKDIYSGVKFGEGGSKSLNHRPDFVICLNGDVTDPKFVIDSKDPAEGIDDHLGQLRSYAISVGRNLLMITNGKELKVYDVNDLLLHTTDIEDLQSKIDYLIELLGRSNQSLKSPIDIIKDFDYKSAINATDQEKLDGEIRLKKLLLSDFRPYLSKLVSDFTNWHLPTQHFQAFSNLELEKIDPNVLLSFRQYTLEPDRLEKQKSLKLAEIETDRTLNIKIIVGETGSGKSCLLKYLVHRAAQNCLVYREVRIPVFISLREIGIHNKLEDLIVDFLNRYGYSCRSIYDLPPTNDFVLFLDAYDEIGEYFLPGTLLAIEHLSAKYECYLTTRPSRLPQLQPSVIVNVIPISEPQIKAIVRQHIEDGYFEFQQQLESKNLTLESGNILLLLSLISVFKESGRLPTTVPQLMHIIVGRVKKWLESKKGHTKQLTWYSIEQFLATLAYKLIESGETALTMSDSQPMLLKTLMSLEQERKIPGGLSIPQILDSLAETGLVIVNNDHLYFWHRLFLNYFGAQGLKVRYDEEPKLIQRLAQEKRWHIAIVGLACLLPSITKLIEVLKDNLWLSAYCLVENGRCDIREVQQIVDELIEQLASFVPDVRSRACTYLANINHEYTKKFFFEAVEGDYFSDIRMMALSVIGKTRSEEARTIIYRHLHWDESLYIFGPSAQEYVARALYYFHEEEHLQIIENWSKTPHYLMSSECKKIFIELHSQQKLTSKLIAALRQLFISEFTAEPCSREKLDALAHILSVVPDDAFTARLIDLSFIHNDFSRIDSIYELLKDCRSEYVIRLIKEKILENASQNYVVEKLVEVLTNSAWFVPKEIFLELIGHPDVNVASKAIGALKRFPYDAVRQEVEKYLYGTQPQFQSWALDVLVDNMEIVYLIRNQLFPKQFFHPTAHTLLKAVRRFHLVEALQLMERIFNVLKEHKKFEHDIHLTMDLAGTYYYIGEKKKQTEIISWLFDGVKFLQPNDHIHINIMKSLKYFDPALSLEVAECYFRTYLPFQDDDIYFKMNIFVETVEELSQRALVFRIKEIVDVLLEEVKKDNRKAAFHLERPMRALVRLVQATDEDWLLERLDFMKYDDGLQCPQLRRATQCLAHSGSAKSLPYLRQLAVQFKYSEMMLNDCQFAYEQICQREKISFVKGDLLQS